MDSNDGQDWILTEIKKAINEYSQDVIYKHKKIQNKNNSQSINLHPINSKIVNEYSAACQ